MTTLVGTELVYLYPVAATGQPSGYSEPVSMNDVKTFTGGGGGGTPGGSTTQLQYNNAGSFGGVSGVTSDGTSLTFSDASLKLTGSSSGTSTISAPASGGGAITLPAGAVTLMANPMTTGGDVIYGGASGVATRLANGSAGQVLTSNGTTLAPSWQAGGGGITIGTTTITGGTTTRLLYDLAGVVSEITGATSDGTKLTLTSPVIAAEETFPIAVGGMYSRPIASSVNSVPWRQVVNTYDFGSYHNEVVAFGWNVGATVGNPSVAGQPMYWDACEYRYSVGGRLSGERHWNAMDTSGVSRRPWGFSVPEDGGVGSAHELAVDTIAWFDFAATPNLIIQWSNSVGVADLGNSTKGYTLRFGKNNVPVCSQYNAAQSSLINLPYYNASDVLLSGGQEQHNVNGAVGSGNSAITNDFTACTLSDGAILRASFFPTVTNKSVVGNLIQGSTNYALTYVIQNTAASGRAYYLSQTGATGTGSFQATNGTTTWAFGLNSSGNCFIGIDDLGSGDIFTVNKTTKVLNIINDTTCRFLTTQGLVRVSTQFDKTSDVTLANVPGLSVTVLAGKSYGFTATLYTSSNVAGGVQAAIAGTATATAVIYEGETTAGAAIGAQTRATALATAVGALTTVTAARIDIEGTITVNAGGTLTVQFAQNASNGAASSVLVGSVFEVWQIN